MKLVSSFAPSAFNPFDTASDDKNAEVRVADWDNLPSDVKGIILDYCAASSPQDFVNLSSCSKAWRYASLTKSRRQGGKLRELKAAFSEEKSFVLRNRANRERVLKKAIGLKLRADACYLCILFFFLLIGSICILSGALGIHFLGVEIPANSGNSSMFLCPNTTNASGTVSNGTNCCSSVSAADPLRNVSIALAVTWMTFGGGMFFLALMALYYECRPERDNVSSTGSCLLGLSTLALVLGFLGLSSIIPGWVLLDSIPSVCVNAAFRGSFRSYLVAETVIMAISWGIVLLVLLLACMT